MPRPTKCRRVCSFPQTLAFTPSQNAEENEPVILTVDEYETIRLIDKEGLSQEQCSNRMQIARTTAQKIYENARRKIADALVEGLSLEIRGGEYQLCDGRDALCKSNGCYKQLLHQQYAKTKGEYVMRIAVTYENEEIFQHFGHTQQFKIYDTEGDHVLSSEIVDTNGRGHGALAEILHALRVDILICGGIGGGAQTALAAVGIQLYGGISGNADAAVDALLAGNLNRNPNVSCSHHGGHHHENGHSCGEHGCGRSC